MNIKNEIETGLEVIEAIKKEYEEASYDSKDSKYVDIVQIKRHLAEQNATLLDLYSRIEYNMIQLKKEK